MYRPTRHQPSQPMTRSIQPPNTISHPMCGGRDGGTHSVHTYPGSLPPPPLPKQMVATLGATLSPQGIDKQRVHTWGRGRVEEGIKRRQVGRKEGIRDGGSTPFVANIQHHEVPKFEKPHVREQNIPFPTSATIQQATLAPEPTSQNGKGEGRIAQHSWSDCGVFLCPLSPPPPLKVIEENTELCCYDHARVTRGRMRAQYPLPLSPSPQNRMLCVSLLQAVYVLEEGWGVHMRMHASSVLVAISVYVMPPPPPRSTLLNCFLFLFYQSRLERFVFSHDSF